MARARRRRQLVDAERRLDGEFGYVALQAYCKGVGGSIIVEDEIRHYVLRPVGRVWPFEGRCRLGVETLYQLYGVGEIFAWYVELGLQTVEMAF